MRGLFKQRTIRFVGGGLLNTTITYVTYLALNYWIGYQMAYLIAYATAIVFSYFFNNVIVFKGSARKKSGLAYLFMYAIQYVFSASLLLFFVGGVGVDAKIAPILVLCISVPLSYQLNKRFFK
jgi:putative flippase GtrA